MSILQEISVVRTQVTHLRLLVLRQPQISWRLVPLPVGPRAENPVYRTAQCAQTDECYAYAVSGSVPWLSVIYHMSASSDF